MVAVVGALAVVEFDVVFTECQSRKHLLVGERPVAKIIIEIVTAILQKYAQRFFVATAADHTGVGIAAANVGEAADVREHFAELVGPLPGNSERTDSATRHAAD